MCPTSTFSASTPRCLAVPALSLRPRWGHPLLQRAVGVTSLSQNGTAFPAQPSAHPAESTHLHLQELRDRAGSPVPRTRARWSHAPEGPRPRRPAPALTPPAHTSRDPSRTQPPPNPPHARTQLITAPTPGRRRSPRANPGPSPRLAVLRTLAGGPERSVPTPPRGSRTAAPSLGRRGGPVPPGFPGCGLPAPAPAKPQDAEGPGEARRWGRAVSTPGRPPSPCLRRNLPLGLLAPRGLGSRT